MPACIFSSFFCHLYLLSLFIIWFVQFSVSELMIHYGFQLFSVFLITFPSTTKLLLRAPFPPFVLSQTKTFSSFLNTTELHFLYILPSVGDQCAFHIVQIYYEFSLYDLITSEMINSLENWSYSQSLTYVHFKSRKDSAMLIVL